MMIEVFGFLVERFDTNCRKVGFKQNNIVIIKPRHMFLMVKMVNF